MQQTNPFAVKLPLLQVAHPSRDACDAEARKLRDKVVNTVLNEDSDEEEGQVNR